MHQTKGIAVIIILLLLSGLVTVTGYTVLNKRAKQVESKKFYVGVTYCGNSIQEAKELIDKVKNYTNLFILQSGIIEKIATVEEIGDYVISSELSYALYHSNNVQYDTNGGNEFSKWAITAKERWGEQFIGVYYYDEPGGIMLDDSIDYLENTIFQTENGREWSYISKGARGEIVNHYYSENTTYSSSSVITYLPDGKIVANYSLQDKNSSSNISITYYPDGTIKDNFDEDAFYASENITKYPHQILSYEEILKQNPIQTYDDAAKIFVNMNKERLDVINKKQLGEESILVFTSDYALHWWNYKGGYDVIFAELAWNNSVTQEIGLVRGAAKLQGKSWGTILTWKYTHPPFLTDGDEMFEQMKTSYQTGAEYVLIFNYSEDRANPNTLQEEHFQAIERFWKDIVQNPKIKHGNVKAEAAIILPKNYGWGMRHPNDNIWGIWQPDDTAQEIWNQIQNKIDKHGLKIDIIFEDTDYPVAGKYSKIYYWNQK